MSGARRKRRSRNQILEEKSYTILRDKLPESWVIHEYGPDYGIDYVIELFDYIDETKKMSETLGENFFVQLKSSESIQYKTIKVYPRTNVEKGSLNKGNSEEYINVEVAKFQLEMSELLTVQSMGSAIPVLLILVDINTKRIFFICLNDYIDKILIPKNKDYSSDGSKILNIPIQNEIKNNDINLVALRSYGKRSKMYGAFAKFHYQKNEIERSLSSASANQGLSEAINMVATFTQTAIQQDIWKGAEFWPPIQDLYKTLKQVEIFLETGVELDKQQDFMHHCLTVWFQLTNLGNMYEELVREWYIPTFLAQNLSYPDYPEVITVQKTGK